MGSRGAAGPEQGEKQGKSACVENFGAHDLTTTRINQSFRRLAICLFEMRRGSPVDEARDTGTMMLLLQLAECDGTRDALAFADVFDHFLARRTRIAFF